MVISKVTDPKKDARSGFEGSSLADRLEDLNVKTIFVLGPAIQDCLTQTVLEACRLNLQVVVLKDAIGTVATENTFKKISQTGALQASASDLGIKPA